MRAMRFNPIVEYVPGKQLVIADALSRKPLVGGESRINDIKLSDDITAIVDAVQQSWPLTEDRLTEISVETSTDPIMKSITDFIANGWPSHESVVPHSVRDYYRERALLSLNDGVTYKLQIVMNQKMRDDALRRLHESHQGISKCRERAASAIWWPGVSRDITRFIDRCDTCRRNRPTQRGQPLRPVELPGRTCEKVAMDLNLNGIRRKEANIGYYIRRGLCAHVIECLSRRSGD